ncbi:MAG: hypothetical protein IKP10_05645 [Clostridia bacterium]|nr:hypothetical protein [Clostridia bacterium]
MQQITVTIEGVNSEPIRFTDVEGLVLLAKHPDGAAKAVMGSLNIQGLTTMMRALISGDDASTYMIKMALALANMLPEASPDSIVDMTPGRAGGTNDPFAELMKELKQKWGHQ